MRKPNKVGGGAKTNINGLQFEQNTSLLADIETTKRYKVSYGCDQNADLSPRQRRDYASRKTCGQVLNLKTGKEVAQYFEKDILYKQFLEVHGVHWGDHISAQLLPDGCLIIGKTAVIIEKKYQTGGGSVDEKLQTCDFKKKQYQKLFTPIAYDVRYIYLLNDWFDQPRFDDVFNYIKSMGCEYFIDVLPLKAVGL